MHTLIKPLMAATAAAGLAACATSTPYTKASGPDDPGYRTSQVAQDTYRVVFEGNESTPRQTVETYLLYRAAQLAQKDGAQYFVVRTKDTQTQYDIDTYANYNTYTSAPGFYGYGFGYDYAFPYYTAYPSTTGYTGFDPVGPTVDVDDSYQAVAFIETFDQRPETDQPLYRTSEVIDRLRDEIRRPG